MITREQYLEAIEICKQYRSQHFQEIALSDFAIQPTYTKDMLLKNAQISSRLNRCLRSFYYYQNLQFSNITIADVMEIKLSQFKKIRGAGKAMCDEFQNLLANIV